MVTRAPSILVPYVDGERLSATENLVLSRCCDRNICRSECVAGVKSGKSSWWAGERGCWGLYSGLDPGTEFFKKSLYLFIFHWLLIALQYWFDFCLTSAGLNHGGTKGLSLSNPSLLPPIPIPLVITEPQFEFPESYSKFPLAIYFTYVSVYASMLLSPFISPSPFWTESLKKKLISRFRIFIF